MNQNNVTEPEKDLTEGEIETLLVATLGSRVNSGLSKSSQLLLSEKWVDDPEPNHWTRGKTIWCQRQDESDCPHCKGDYILAAGHTTWRSAWADFKKRYQESLDKEKH